MKRITQFIKIFDCWSKMMREGLRLSFLLQYLDENNEIQDGPHNKQTDEDRLLAPELIIILPLYLLMMSTVTEDIAYIYFTVESYGMIYV